MTLTRANVHGQNSASVAGGSSATPPMPPPREITSPLNPLLLAIPSFVTNSETLLRLSNRAVSGKSVPTAMKTSKLEEEALRQILRAGFPEPEREHQFVPDRKWRFDIAWPREKIALEVEGGIWIQGRHSTGAGMEADMEKYNRAQIEGWTVLRVSSNHIKRGEIVPMLEKLLCISTV